jgi:Aminotransferase class-V
MDPHPGLADGPVYLDYNATTPTDPRVVEAMLPYLSTHFGNPSSGHRYGAAPAEALAAARCQIARLIGAQPAEIVFTGSGSGRQSGHPRCRTRPSTPGRLAAGARDQPAHRAPRRTRRL